MNKNYKEVKEYISSIEKYQIKNEEEISINYKLLNDDINNINRDLISALLKNKLCKDLFFDKFEDVYVFNQNSFIEIIFKTNEYMEGSFTKYENKIGLFLKEEDTVQLNFPYKDCVLVGGMDKEDDKVNLEIFYNEILEKDRINKLFEPKVFHNIKKYYYSKELAEDDTLDNPNNIQVDSNIDNVEFETIIDDEGNEKEKLKDNLLIKGNNLLGLHSIERRLSGSIDVIYIDPPYYFNDTKASDSFAYNSNFKLSSWLTFMKNRLEIAKELLSEEGVIFISMNEEGNSYLRLLCDEIFGMNNFVSNIIWKCRTSLQYSDPLISSQTDNVLCYTKNRLEWNNKRGGGNGMEFNVVFKETDKMSYKNPDNDPNGPWVTSGIIRDDGRKKYSFENPNGKVHIKAWLYQENNMKKLKEENLLYYGEDGNSIPRKKSYAKDYVGRVSSNLIYDEFLYIQKKDGENKYEKSKKIFEVGSNDLGSKTFKSLFKGSEINFQGPKPKEIIAYLINLYPNKNAIILDFFGGSGTTAHSVLSLNKEDNGNRKFILLEQMDYIENITAERIRRCMIKDNCEDSFIYMEMKESNNKELKNSIKLVSSKEDLISLINDNFDNGYFINIDNKEQLLLKIENVYSKATKKSNPLNESIKLIIEKHMDNNIDYVSNEDIEELNLKDNEYKLNKTFYEGK